MFKKNRVHELNSAVETVVQQTQFLNQGDEGHVETYLYQYYELTLN